MDRPPVASSDQGFALSYTIRNEHGEGENGGLKASLARKSRQSDAARRAEAEFAANLAAVAGKVESSTRPPPMLALAVEETETQQPRKTQRRDSN